MIPMDWSPECVVTDVVPYILECRRQGLVFRDCGGNQLAAGPQHLIDAALVAGIRARKDAILALLRQEVAAGDPVTWPTATHRPRKPPGVPPEGPGELDRLAAWLKATAWPTEPFLLSRGVLVADPARQREYLLAACAANPRGRVRVGLLSHLRRLKRLAESMWTLTKNVP